MNSEYSDQIYQHIHYKISELPHNYGDRVHLLGNPFSLSQLAKLCHPDTFQPRINDLVAQLYRHLTVTAIDQDLPRTVQTFPTRMIEHSEKGVFQGELLDPHTKVVCVNIARAGTLPSQITYDMLNTVLTPKNIRQDHILMSRVTGKNGEVVGAKMSGGKIGGRIEDSYVLFPDPMGATGNSLAFAIKYYMKNYGIPKAFLTLNLIVTPQFIRSLLSVASNIKIYGLRLDRGMSSPEVLKLPFGEKWEEESGLTEEDYIVPGGGGFGEIMNNSFV